VTTITSDRYQDVLFELPDGRQMLVMVSKDGRYRLMERTKDSPWSLSVPGQVVK
jgi:hypothetical protein